MAFLCWFTADYALSQAHLAMAVSEKLVSGIESSLPSTYIQRSLCEQLRAKKVICILHSERQSRDAMLRTLLAESGSSILAIYSPMKNALSQEDLLKMGTYIFVTYTFGADLSHTRMFIC